MIAEHAEGMDLYAIFFCSISQAKQENFIKSFGRRQYKLTLNAASSNEIGCVR